MQPDDMYQNDPTYFLPREPKEQVIARKREKAQTLEALKTIQEVIKHFEERIKFRDSIASINVDITKSPEIFQKVFEVNSLLRIALEEEKSLLEDLVERHAP